MGLLLEYYRSMWSNDNVARKYWQCGVNDYGSLLWFMNTNFRTIAPAFTNAYDILKDEEGRTAAEFTLVATSGQTKVKQVTVRMRQIWFFYLDAEDRYRRSKRGKVFETAMAGSEFSPEEKDLICYLFLLAAEFNTTSNYLFKRTKELFGYYHDAGFSTQEILDLQKLFISTAGKSSSMSELAKEDYFYISNLYRPYRETDFLKQFYSSSPSDKEELKKYVYNNLAAHASNCILSKKYEPGGNFNKPMIVEVAWILNITEKLLLLGKVGFDKFIDSVLSFYSDFFTVRRERILNFINDHKDVFENIYNVVYDVKVQQTTGLLTIDEIEAIGVVDPTDMQGQAQQYQVSETYKQMAKEQSNYRCILEDTEMCTDHYFTAKKEKQNYVEVHHFIPREFASEFEHTIEILDNYVTLCPCCHRKIHHAVDRERRPMILAIYSKRKDLLKQHGILINSPKDVLKLYKFDPEEIGK